ncbi:MAG: methylmalonyl Co-A mutase-associated GTPase MeaB [Anaerolineaceae bacterium]|nr:methylmalonyl Co-A mutase-associated GTPase MeaB [Anaerolineaceae bacterium]
MKLVEAVLNGDRMALARLLTGLESESEASQKALDLLFPYAGKAHLIGVTGASGTGKSSLVSQLVLAFRRPDKNARPKRTAVVAVDPSSPYTGGALLGDRIRMRDLAGDPGVFIRSMATRGNAGGLARATASSVQVLDAAGFEIILVETVGAGQAEVEIARLADTIVVVEAPGLGDEIQANKAGILEIADILVVNKADRPGVEQTERYLRGMLEMSSKQAGLGLDEEWTTPVLRTNALTGEGLPDLIEAIYRHSEYLKDSGKYATRARARLEDELKGRIQERLLERWKMQTSEDDLQEALEQLSRREISPRQAVQNLVEDKIT